MPEEVLFETGSRQQCTEVASYMRVVADNLARGESITLSKGSEQITLDPPTEANFEVTVERESEEGEPGELSLELVLEWPEDAGEDSDGIAIE